MVTPTAEQVRTLAPDASAARAGQGLAVERRWSSTGRTDAAAWGLCQGSGSSPYQVTVDLAGPAYSCSCPSRKIPCKHTLGLLFLVADGKVGAAQPPDWATSWLEARSARVAAAAARTEQQQAADPVARAKRTEAREQKVAAGLDELDRWLTDLIRRGLDSARTEGYRFWDTMAARLVDAQAAGLGRSVRGLGALAHSGDAWPHFLLDGTARLRLLVEAYRHADALPEGLRSDVRSLVGWTTKEDDLDPADTVDDRWLVVGRRVDDSGQIITARTFLLGEATGRYALHLAFGVDAAPPTVLAVPAEAFRAALTFYPSATPLRAIVRPMLVPDGEVTAVPGAGGIEDVVRAHTDRLARNPFLDAWPVALRDVTPVLRGGRLVVREAAGAALPVGSRRLAARLLAISGGSPVTLVAEWDGAFLRPLGVLADGRLVGLETTDGGPMVAGSTNGAWATLVSAALLGTDRTAGSVPIPEQLAPLVDGRDPETSILVAAGALSVRRRGGRRPPRDAEATPTPAARDPRPPVVGSAARLFALVVEERRDLLLEALGLVRASGRRLPDETLPELMTLAGSNAEVSDAVLELAGPRAGWLASTVPELDGTVPTPLDDDWDARWAAAAGGAVRATLVRQMRRVDATRARESLTRWLPSVPGNERARVVTALDEGLEPADEPLLADALGDGRADVRRAAADLLARIEGSAFALTLEATARPLLRIEGRLRPSLVVTLPELDPDLVAAGLAEKPPAGVGARAWLLRNLFADIPPGRWTEWLRADPRSLVDRAVRAEEARVILDGWIEATITFGDASWAKALMSEPDLPAKVIRNVVDVLGGLDRDERSGVVIALLGRVEPAVLAAAVSRCDPPWTDAVADAVLRVIGKLADQAQPAQPYYDLVRAAALGIPPARSDDLVALASHDGQIRPSLLGPVETIEFRQQLHAAFSGLPAVSPTEGDR